MQVPPLAPPFHEEREMAATPDKSTPTQYHSTAVPALPPGGATGVADDAASEISTVTDPRNAE